MHKIMIVDDSFLVRNILKNYLNNDFIIAGEAKNGDEAVSMYDELLPDLVTMDITMEGMNGLDAAKVILSKHPEANIIMITALNESKLLSEATKIGIKDFLVKPFSADQLFGIIEKIPK